jgi:4-amino-4-deoxy-L-arabinose transferase-like glycosyltransferase
MSDRAVGSDKGLWMVYRENVVRFFHPFDHRGPIYLYVYVIFALMAPWAMLLPAALAEAHRDRHVDSGNARADRFALVFFWATFVFFTLSGSRRSYYILPILPAGAILIARMLTKESLNSLLARRLLAVGYGLIAIAAVAGIVMLVPAHLLLPGKWATLPPAPARLAFAVLWVISVGGVVNALRDYRPIRIGLSVGIIAYLAMAYIYIFAMPAADAYRGEKPFALQTLRLLDGDTSKLVLYRTLGPLFYLNPPTPIPLLTKLPDLQNAISNDGVRWMIVRRRDLPELDVPMKVDLAEVSFPWEDAEQTRNKVLLVHLGPQQAARAR